MDQTQFRSAGRSAVCGFFSVFKRGWHNPGSYQFMEEELPVMPEEIHFTELSLTGVRIMEKSVDTEPCLRM
jgi:hypothetical protein